MVEKNLTEKNTHVYQVKTHACSQGPCSLSGGLSRPYCPSSDFNDSKENTDSSDKAILSPQTTQIVVKTQSIL